jgi:peptidoglycan hydrolase-like protein with peptidoglycan-binding domain
MTPFRCHRFAADPLLESCSSAGATLSAGMAGGSVAKVQQALMDLGYVLREFGPDGVFGPETAEAVAAFNADIGLGRDQPVVGSSTLGALDEYFAGEPPVPPPDSDSRNAAGPRPPTIPANGGADDTAATLGYAALAVDAAVAQAAAGSHFLAGAAGARPGGSEGTRGRPAGVTLRAGRTDPSDPAVFAAMSDVDGRSACAGRFSAGNGGIAGGRPAASTDTDLIVYLAGLAASPESEWRPFFQFFSPRRVGAGRPPSAQVVWGEDCRSKQHFDGVGLVNWCMEQAIGGRYPITLDLATWATDERLTQSVGLGEMARTGDIVLRAMDGRLTHIGLLVADGDPAMPTDHGHVVLAEQPSVGVVLRRFSPAGWAIRRRATPTLLHD